MSPATSLEPATLRSKQDLVLRLQVALCDFVISSVCGALVLWLSGRIAQGPGSGRFSRDME